MTRLVSIALCSTLALAAGGCERPQLNTGGDCSLNSDCVDPLVCRLERCRRQCIDSRDCGAGLMCLAVGELGGACQLPNEAACALTSDCESSGLVCRFATCTTECVEDRDCPSGAMCRREGDDGPLGCVEPVSELCIYDSDCPAPLTCHPDQRCGLECVEPRDCPAPRICVDNLCQLTDDGGP